MNRYTVQRGVGWRVTCLLVNHTPVDHLPLILPSQIFRGGVGQCEFLCCRRGDRKIYTKWGWVVGNLFACHHKPVDHLPLILPSQSES